MYSTARLNATLTTVGHYSAARMRRLKSKYFLALSCFSIPTSKKERIRAAETKVDLAK